MSAWSQRLEPVWAHARQAIEADRAVLPTDTLVAGRLTRVDEG